MAILPICQLTKNTLRMKDFSLRQPCRKINCDEFNSEWLQNIIFDMFETLYSTSSGVGLAAPQVGMQLQLIVVDIKRNGKNPLVLINPEYSSVSNTKVDSVESCLSVPGLSGNVKRYESIKLKYYDLYGNLVEKDCSGFESKVFQHEIDHINGIVYIDKLSIDEDLAENLGQPNRIAKAALNNITNRG